MKILVINSGSSSIKYQMYEMPAEKVLAAGIIERIGEKQGHTRHSNVQGNTYSEDKPVAHHQEGFEIIARLLMDKQYGSIQQPEEVFAVSHRVVHGGELFRKTTLIDEAVKQKIKELFPLAPLHNPPNLTGIEVAQKVFFKAKQVAVFDTAFHQSMPEKAYRYAIPHSFYQEHGIRAYGMHGTSHRYVTNQAANYLQKPLEQTSLITLHLGNGCSMAAIRGGKCIDTTMGLSPLAGLMMGSRSGDIDPTVPYFMGTKLGMSFEEIDQLLNKKSGLTGLTGSNDLRDILKMSEGGDTQAQLALDMYTYRIKKYIGAYYAALGRVDALVFTAGVGENSSYVRWHACEGLENMGIRLDREKNECRASKIIELHSGQSPVKVLAIPTNEELEIARQSFELLK
ncbi:acetate kinase [Rapidithrix thailandica]|uniref:Acetate kinase n=1 Tax=Rapidithrix thailandica TaxID=413964 RepID=A0AAW9S2I2_9BACT